MSNVDKKGLSAGRRFAQQARLWATASMLALAAGAILPGAALAANYTAGSEAELDQALLNANASPDAASTITLTNDIAVTNPSAIATLKTITIDMAGHTVTGGTFNPTPGVGAPAYILTDGGTFQVTSSSSLFGSISVVNSTLIIKNGAQVSNGGAGPITGTLDITGAGSSMTVGQLHAGLSSGVTTIQVDSGGLLHVSSTTTLGQVDGAQVNLLITGAGSTFTSGFANSFGAAGTSGQAAVTIADGGAMNLTLATTDGGATATGVSSLLVTGAGSTFTEKTSVTFLRSSISVQAGAAFSAANLTLGGATSAGTAQVSGSGSTLALTGALTVANGSFSVLNGGAASSATTTIGSLGPATLTLGGGGSLTTTNAVTLGGSGAGHTGVLNIGSALGSAAAGSGALTASSLMLANAASQVNFNHTDANYVFATPISGSGAINQAAGVTHLTGDSSAFTGATTVTGGELHVDGALGGAASTLSVQNNGLLAGFGTVGGGATIQSGGVVSPGGLGALHVNGAFAQAAGSTYRATLNPASSASDQIVVGGAASIASGANLQVLSANGGAYKPGTVYTVLTANGGVTGTYALSGAQVSAFLGLKDSYDANHVYLTVVQTQPLTGAAQTGNQQAVASSVPDGGAIGSALLNLPSATAARSAFDQLSGQGQAAAKGVLVTDARLVRDLAIDRTRTMLCAPGAADTVSGCRDAHEGSSTWAEGFGAWGRSDSTANASGARRSTGGFLIGGDLPLPGQSRAGVFAGYSRTGLDVDSGSADIDNYHAGVYGGTQRGALGFRAGGSFTYQAIDSTRQVAFGDFANRLQASYGAHTVQGYAEAAYQLPGESSTPVEGFADIAYVNAHSQGFTETGGPAALSAQAQDTGVTFTTVGFRPSAAVQFGPLQAALRAEVAWRYAFGDITPTSRVAFAGGPAFTVEGVPLARSSAVLQAGADARLSQRLTFGLTYGAQLANSENDQTVTANLVWRF